jgi:asparagine synthetase B (glutamine-hydrolysing)
MLLKIQTKTIPYTVITQQDTYCSVFQTDTIEVFLVGQIFNDLQNFQNAAHYFYETVANQPEQKIDEIDGYYGVVILYKATASVEVFRDPIGMQPLYYATENDNYLFSSTLKEIKEALPDATICEEFFLKCLEEITPNTHELTIYKEILRIAPNSKYKFKEGKATERYKLFNFNNIAIQNRTDEEAIKLFQENLEKSIEHRIKGQNELFFQYTGGLDSTGILAVTRFLKGNTEGFHSYIHQYFPNHQSFDEMHIVKKLHHTEGLPLPYYTPETHFETLQEEVAHGKKNHTFMLINQVLDNIYIDINHKKGKLLFSGFGGDEGITFNEMPRFFVNQLIDFKIGKAMQSIKVYGIKRYLSQLIKTDLRILFLKTCFPITILPSQFTFRKTNNSSETRKQVYDTHGYIRYMLTLPRVAYRIEEEKELAANYGVTLAYPWLDFRLLCYFLSLKENQLIYMQKGRIFYKIALRKYIQSEWYFNYSKTDSVTEGKSEFNDENELNTQLINQYELAPNFIKKYNFIDSLTKQHKLVKEILLNRLSKINLWLGIP